jgi:hypothetical protein
MDQMLSQLTACCSNEGRLDLGLQKHRESENRGGQWRESLCSWAQATKDYSSNNRQNRQIQIIADSKMLKNVNLGVNSWLLFPSYLVQYLYPRNAAMYNLKKDNKIDKTCAAIRL